MSITNPLEKFSRGFVIYLCGWLSGIEPELEVPQTSVLTFTP